MPHTFRLYWLWQEFLRVHPYPLTAYSSEEVLCEGLVFPWTLHKGSPASWAESSPPHPPGNLRHRCGYRWRWVMLWTCQWRTSEACHPQQWEVGVGESHWNLHPGSRGRAQALQDKAPLKIEVIWLVTFQSSHFSTPRFSHSCRESRLLLYIMHVQELISLGFEAVTSKLIRAWI